MSIAPVLRCHVEVIRCLVKAPLLVESPEWDNPIGQDQMPSKDQFFRRLNMLCHTRNLYTGRAHEIVQFTPKTESLSNSLEIQIRQLPIQLRRL